MEKRALRHPTSSESPGKGVVVVVVVYVDDIMVHGQDSRVMMVKTEKK